MCHLEPGRVIDLSAQVTWDGTFNDTLGSIEHTVGSDFNDSIFGNDEKGDRSGAGARARVTLCWLHWSANVRFSTQSRYKGKGATPDQPVNPLGRGRTDLPHKG